MFRRPLFKNISKVFGLPAALITLTCFILILWSLTLNSLSFSTGGLRLYILNPLITGDAKNNKIFTYKIANFRHSLL